MKRQDFARLKRYPNGDIVDLYNIHHLLTTKQVDQLSDDDWSRVQEYQDELRMMIYELGG
jgi:phage FluMu protein gp41